MDGISGAASVLALVELAGKTITYIKQVKNAPQERQQLLKLLIQSKGILHTLNDLIESVEDEDWATTISSLAESDGPLFQYKDILERIISRLGIDSKESNLHSVLDRLKWPFNRKEVEEMMTALEKLKSTFVIATTNDHVRLSMETHKEVQKANLQIHHMKTVLDTRLISLSPRQKAMVESLSPIRLSGELEEEHIGWLTLTCEWFLEHESFKLWEKGAGPNRTLALIDGPGRGKSSLCKVVHYYLELWLEDNADDCAVYLAVDNQQRSHMDKASILSKIMSLIFLDRPHLIRHLLALRRRNGVLPFDVGIALLQAARADLNQLYITLDGLDEGNNEDICQLLEGLQSIQPPVNLFLASRPVPYLETRAMCRMNPPTLASLREFLIHHIKRALEATPSIMRFLEEGDESITKVANNIATTSGDSYSFAESQIKWLATAETSKIFHRMLGYTSQSIEELYAIELDNVKAQVSNKVALARKVIKMLLNYDGGIILRDCRDALTDDIAQAGISMDLSPNPSERELLDIITSCCKGFVCAVPPTNRIIFVHASQKDFFAVNSL